MKRNIPALKIEFEEINEGLKGKIEDIFAKYTSIDPDLGKYLKEIIDVSIAQGKTQEALKELEAHWEYHLGRAWIDFVGSELTYFMLFDLGERLGIVHL